jgi:TolB protein
MSVDGANQRTVSVHSEDSFPQWSPSTESIAYASSSHGDGRWRLYWQRDASLQTEAPAIIFSGRELFGQYPVYLDNWRIAYQGCNSWAGGSSCGIYTTDTGGGQPNQATTSPNDIPTGNLESQVLFMSKRNGNWDIYVVNWDGSGLRQLTDNGAFDGLATAAPGYQQIAFVSNRDGGWGMYVMDRNGGGQRKLFDLQGGFGDGDFSVVRERISWGP